MTPLGLKGLTLECMGRSLSYWRMDGICVYHYTQFGHVGTSRDTLREPPMYLDETQIKRSMKSYSVEPCERRMVKDFIEKYHYSQSINGLKSSYCFQLLSPEGEQVGAMLYGGLAMANCWQKYASAPEDLVELRRLCCIDLTPKNAESYFIGRTLRWLKKNTSITTVISYADPNYNHAGIIYQASNFTHVGMTSPGRVIMWGAKKYHDKTIRTFNKGVLKPYAQAVRDALESGEASYVKQEPKHIYLYHLKR